MECKGMNATSLYVSTCRVILKAKHDDYSTYSDLYHLFPLLRQSLTCSVCGSLLNEPYTPAESHCQHHVCRSCKGGKKKLRSTCSWCRDYSKYIENVDLRTLLQCYKKFCQYVTSSQLFRSLSALPSSSNINNGSADNNKVLLDILNEGAGLKDDYVFEPNLSLHLSTISAKSKSPIGHDKSIKGKGNVSLANGESTYSVISTNNGHRLTFKRTAKEMNGEEEKGIKINKVRKRSVFLKPPTCKCGQNGPTKGTCRGYRCPCYTADKPCSPECNCVACKNPRGSPPPKEEETIEIKKEIMDETVEVTTA